MKNKNIWILVVEWGQLSYKEEKLNLTLSLKFNIIYWFWKFFRKVFELPNPTKKISSFAPTRTPGFGSGTAAGIKLVDIVSKWVGINFKKITSKPLPIEQIS